MYTSTEACTMLMNKHLEVDMPACMGPQSAYKIPRLYQKSAEAALTLDLAEYNIKITFKKYGERYDPKFCE